MNADKTAADSIFREGRDIVKMSECGAPRPPYVTSESALMKSAPFTAREDSGTCSPQYRRGQSVEVLSRLLRTGDRARSKSQGSKIALPAGSRSTCG